MKSLSSKTYRSILSEELLETLTLMETYIENGGNYLDPEYLEMDAAREKIRAEIYDISEVR